MTAGEQAAGSAVVEEIAAEVGPPVARSCFAQGDPSTLKDGPLVMCFRTTYRDKTITVGKCLGKTDGAGQLAVSPVGRLVVRVITQAKPSRVLIVSTTGSKDIRRLVVQALEVCEPSAAVLFLTEDERQLSQLTWLLGLHLGGAFGRVH